MSGSALTESHTEKNAEDWPTVAEVIPSIDKLKRTPEKFARIFDPLEKVEHASYSLVDNSGKALEFTKRRGGMDRPTATRVGCGIPLSVPRHLRPKVIIQPLFYCSIL